MTFLAETAQRCNAPNGRDLPLFSYRPNHTVSSDLTPGGAIIHRRTRRPASTCNLIAALAGLGGEYDHAR